MLDVKDKINELIFKDDDRFICKECNKTGTDIRNMKTHVEIHMEGLEYDCQNCDKTFRSKNSLNFHNNQKHR